MAARVLRRATLGVSPEPEKSKGYPPPTPIFLLGENVTRGGCDVWGARYLAQGVARELRHTRCGEIALTKPVQLSRRVCTRGIEPPHTSTPEQYSKILNKTKDKQTQRRSLIRDLSLCSQSVCPTTMDPPCRQKSLADQGESGCGQGPRGSRHIPRAYDTWQ